MWSVTAPKRAFHQQRSSSHSTTLHLILSHKLIKSALIGLPLTHTNGSFIAANQYTGLSL